MRIFVSEYVCGGAWPDELLPEPMAREGRAMLLALLEDAVQVDGWTICTTWDRRQGSMPLSGVATQFVDGPAAEAMAFARMARECDASYVIAPELDHLLTQRCQHVSSLGAVSLNSTLPAINVCSDKLALARILEDAGIPTLPTQQLDGTTMSLPDLPLIVKPRFGAGSHEIWLVETRRRLDEIQSRFADDPACRQAIVQPFVKGMPVSVAAFVDDQGRVLEFGPVVEQLLSVDGRFTFLGGRIPANIACEDEIRRIARRAVSAVAGLSGYVGLDLLVPHQRQQPLIVEINPRLTTSYIGYRALTTGNLAKRILQPDSDHGAIDWTGSHLLFTSQGSVSPTSGPVPRTGASAPSVRPGKST